MYSQNSIVKKLSPGKYFQEQLANPMQKYKLKMKQKDKSGCQLHTSDTKINKMNYGPKYKEINYVTLKENIGVNFCDFLGLVRHYSFIQYQKHT